MISETEVWLGKTLVNRLSRARMQNGQLNDNDDVVCESCVNLYND